MAKSFYMVTGEQGFKAFEIMPPRNFGKRAKAKQRSREKRCQLYPDRCTLA